VQTLHNFRFFCTNSLFYRQGRICERCKYGNTLHAVSFRCYHDSYTLSALYALTIGQHRRLGTFQLIDRFIALNEFAVKTFVESAFTTADKMTVLGNFLPEPLPEAGSFSHREPYVLFLGRLSAEKGVEQLIEAMASVPDLTLKVLGKWAEKEALQRHVQELGLNNVEFLGWVGGSEKWQLLRQARASVMPSVCYEQFPLAALESLAVGTPVVASNLGGLPSLIKHEKTGLLFKAADATDLANQLNKLLRFPQLAYQMGPTARQTVESHYVASVHYQKLMSIYGEVVS
jgi:glycosyltransferase involved in cell wall biosynthesis